MRKFFILVSAAVCMMAAMCSCQSDRDVRLLYWNIQNGMWSDQGNNYDNFVEFVKSQEPDICVWCEAATIYNDGTADKRTGDKYLPANWDSLAERYGHKYVYLGGWRDNYPQVITSKFPIRNVKRILGDPEKVIVAHGAGWAQIEVAGKTLNIVTLHTWPHPFAYLAEDRQASAAKREGDSYRAREMELICNETIGSVASAKDEYWMMMGDFNSISPIDNFQYNLPLDTCKFFVHNYVRNNTPYLDVIAEKYPGEFITSNHGQSRIDYVYCTQPLYDCIENAEILQDGGWLTIYRDPQNLSNFYHPSDHRPIVVDFKLK